MLNLNLQRGIPISIKIEKLNRYISAASLFFIVISLGIIMFSFSLDNIKTIQLFLILAFITGSFGGMCILISVALSFWAETKARRDLQNLLKEWHLVGVKSGIRQTTETLDGDPSVLRNIMMWMYDYSKDKGNIESAFNIFTQLLSRFSTLELHPIGEIGDKTVFDPLKHRNYQLNVQKGETVIIVESGWILEEQLIRKPLVERTNNE